MDHSENDKRFCVYVLKDSDGNIRYVGSGTEIRAYKKHRSNNKALLSMIDDLHTEIIETDLSKDESILKEIDLYEHYVHTGMLLNRQRPTGITPIEYTLVDSYLYYDETSPTFLRWKVDIPSGRYGKIIKIKAGDVAGTIKESGYSETKLLGRLYKNHRLVWVLCTKENLTSNLVIDHINRQKSDNRISNLRLVSQKVNMDNTSNDGRSNSGIVGVNIIKHAPIVRAYWKSNFITKARGFNFRKLFPELPEDIAINKCIEIAAWYREQMLSMQKQEELSTN